MDGKVSVVITPSARCSGAWYADKVGEVFTVSVGETRFHYDDEAGNRYAISKDHAVIIKPINRPRARTDRDLIIELAYTVAKLERKVERLEESLEKTDGKAEMLFDDVVMLDERTQPLTDDGAKEFAEGLSEVIEGFVKIGRAH